MSNTPITRGTVFIPAINANLIISRKAVVVEVVSETSFHTRAVFLDKEGNDEFRPGAGGTAGIENIGLVTGQIMSDVEIKELKRKSERI